MGLCIEDGFPPLDLQLGVEVHEVSSQYFGGVGVDGLVQVLQGQLWITNPCGGGSGLGEDLGDEVFSNGSKVL